MAGRIETVRLHASTDMAAVHGADLVLCCVKSTDTDAAARQMAPHLQAPTPCAEPAERRRQRRALARQLPCTVVAAVVYVATAHARARAWCSISAAATW